MLFLPALGDFPRFSAAAVDSLWDGISLSRCDRAVWGDPQERIQWVMGLIDVLFAEDQTSCHYSHNTLLIQIQIQLYPHMHKP